MIDSSIQERWIGVIEVGYIIFSQTLLFINVTNFNYNRIFTAACAHDLTTFPIFISIKLYKYIFFSSGSLNLTSLVILSEDIYAIYTSLAVVYASIGMIYNIYAFSSHFWSDEIWILLYHFFHASQTIPSGHIVIYLCLLNEYRW